MKSHIVGQGSFEAMEDSVEQAVVQVFSQVVKFNWLEPYAAGEQGEMRGSGFFIDERGYIVTNAHVVNEAKEIWVQIPTFGQKSFFVDLIGFCPEQDLAILKLTNDDRAIIESITGRIPYLELGDSDELRRTDPVVVLGYPLGQLRIKSSTGVIAGWETGPKGPLIQITAPINKGNSGGPLVNAQGQAIGIATLGAVNAINVGYAIPINELKLIIEDLYSPGLVRKPKLGIIFNFGSEALATALGNPRPSGLYINNVCTHSLAYKAGIKPGDMLYTFNTLTVDAYGDLTVPWSNDRISVYDLIARLHRDSPIAMTVYRQGAKHEISFTYDHSELYPIRTKYPDFEEIDYEIIAGMIVMELTENHIELLLEEAPCLHRYSKMECKAEPALIITHVLPGSLAQLSRNLAPGNIIKEINGKKATSLKSFRSALKLSATTGILTVETEDKVLIALSLKKILEYEIRLAKHFSYKLSDALSTMVE